MDDRLQLLRFTSGNADRLTAALDIHGEFKLQLRMLGQQLRQEIERAPVAGVDPCGGNEAVRGLPKAPPPGPRTDGVGRNDPATG